MRRQRQPRRSLDARAVGGFDVDDDIGRVEHAIMFEIVEQRDWRGLRIARQENGHARNALWRTRRERYWMSWVGGLSVSAVLFAGLLIIGFWPVPGADDIGYRALQGFAAMLALGVSWLSFYRWQTPMAAVRDKLGVEGWVRYASLDVDNTVGDQVRRDKERLVEYRALTRGR